MMKALCHIVSHERYSTSNIWLNWSLNQLQSKIGIESLNCSLENSMLMNCSVWIENLKAALAEADITSSRFIEPDFKIGEILRELL